ncbi:hypothetical protein BDV93DRAFT_505581 [Ceratobasidium sp. AG-I]|nr:hypothetical protein BDV93DRAFT_505581 [Ceratobasidium sp. AG-I]
MSRSGAEETNMQFYVSEITALCSAQSQELQQFCTNRLNNRLVPEIFEELLGLIHEQDLLSQLFKATNSGADRIVPTAMRHMWGLVNQVITKASTSDQGARSALESILNVPPFNQPGHAPGERKIPTSVDEMGLTRIWFHRLQALARQTPGLVDDSRILGDMLNYYEASSRRELLVNVWAGRLRDLQGVQESNPAEAEIKLTSEYQPDAMQSGQGEDSKSVD